MIPTPEEVKKRIQAEKDARLVSEDKTITQEEQERLKFQGGQEVIDEIEAFLAELKRRAQFAYPFEKGEDVQDEELEPEDEEEGE